MTLNQRKATKEVKNVRCSSLVIAIKLVVCTMRIRKALSNRIMFEYDHLMKCALKNKIMSMYIICTGAAVSGLG